MSKVGVIYRWHDRDDRDPESGHLGSVDFNSVYEHIPELKRLQIEITTKSFNSLDDSSEMKPEDWIEIARIIKEEYDDFNGFVILHGTDTMSYAASALSFMIQDLKNQLFLLDPNYLLASLGRMARKTLLRL